MTACMCAGGLLTQSSWYAQLVADEIRARLGPGAHLIFQQVSWRCLLPVPVTSSC